MQDLPERFRRWIDQMVARSERAMAYWEKIPLYRMGDEYLNRSEAVIKYLVEGKGELFTITADAAFLLWLINEKGPEIRAQLDRIKGAPVTETREEERDLDREEWERKRLDKKGGGSPGNEDWRG